MSLISWNCQGFGATLAIQNLREEVRKERPQIVFLMETKQKRKFLERKRRALNFEEAWYVDPIGLGGVLALWWKENVVVNIISSSRNVIHTKIDSVSPNFPDYITFIYGPPIENERMLIWDQLRRMASSIVGSWLCVGDFNDLLSQGEKMGGNPHVLRRILNFQLLVSDCELMEI